MLKDFIFKALFKDSLFCLFSIQAVTLVAKYNWDVLETN